MGRAHKEAVEAVRALINYTEDGHCWVFSQAHRLYGSAGIPDVFCVVRGQAFFVEVKPNPKEKLRVSQAQFKSISDAAGVPVIVGRAKDVMEFLSDHATTRREATLHQPTPEEVARVIPIDIITGEQANE